jgi:hypothetical protein
MDYSVEVEYRGRWYVASKAGLLGLKRVVELKPE